VDLGCIKLPFEVILGHGGGLATPGLMGGAVVGRHYEGGLPSHKWLDRPMRVGLSS